MQPQNATIAEGFTGLQRNIGAHALPPTASPDCSDVGLQGTQGVLTTRRSRQRAHLFPNNLTGAGWGVFPEGTYLYTAQTDGGIYYDEIPTSDTPTVPTNGTRVVICFDSGWTNTQSGAGTTTGTTISFPTPYDLSIFGLISFRNRPGYNTEDSHSFTGTVTSAIVTLQLRINSVWTNWVTSNFDSATGWSQLQTDIALAGTVDAGRTVTTIVAGTGDLTGSFRDGAIALCYGGIVSTENA